MAFFKGLWYVYQMVITTNIYGLPYTYHHISHEIPLNHHHISHENAIFNRFLYESPGRVTHQADFIRCVSSIRSACEASSVHQKGHGAICVDPTSWGERMIPVFHESSTHIP